MNSCILAILSCSSLVLCDKGFGAGPVGLGQYAPGGGAFGAPGTGEEGSLEETIPGTPGEDYPILSEVPETSFTCDGQVDGGYYGDVEAECQAFHICANDGSGGLTKYSFLCPNGTLFQQQYFVCDWWFNVDCSLAVQFYSLNEEVAAERAANSPPGSAGAGDYQGGASGRGGNGGRGGAGGRRGSLGSGSSPESSYTVRSGFGGSQAFGGDAIGIETGYGAVRPGGQGGSSQSGYSRRNARDTNLESNDGEVKAS